ncbi:MAG: AGE family epimerase/isomerase [Tangfeifania sp.]
MDLKKLKKEFENELTDNILNYWVKEVYDPQRKMFYGRITNDGKKFPEAPLSAVFTTRIMWTFAAAYRHYPTAIYKKMADEAFRILKEWFWDPVNGGIYWSVNPDGTPVDTKKQFYAEAFFIYALSEYYLAFQDETAKQIAISMFMLMERYAFDPEYGGYIEAKTAGWEDTDDLRLSPKEPDVKKSMNTHLHILEAYTSLYRIHKTEDTQNKLHHLIRIFLDKIIDPETYHFHLFFDADWTVRSDIDSYGHDIEGSWLLCEAAEVLGDKHLLEEVRKVALKMAEVTKKEGLDKNGGLYYEKAGNHLQEQFDWWPQAEAVVGFFNAWQLNGNEKYLELAKQNWNFIQKYIIDHRKGEWFWGVSSDLKPLPNDKVNGWKAPYHNSRMCMEMMRRIDSEL